MYALGIRGRLGMMIVPCWFQFSNLGPFLMLPLNHAPNLAETHTNKTLQFRFDITISTFIAFMTIRFIILRLKLKPFCSVLYCGFFVHFVNGQTD